MICWTMRIFVWFAYDWMSMDVVSSDECWFVKVLRWFCPLFVWICLRKNLFFDGHTESWLKRYHRYGLCSQIQKFDELILIFYSVYFEAVIFSTVETSNALVCIADWVDFWKNCPTHFNLKTRHPSSVVPILRSASVGHRRRRRCRATGARRKRQARHPRPCPGHLFRFICSWENI